MYMYLNAVWDAEQRVMKPGCQLLCNIETRLGTAAAVMIKGVMNRVLGPYAEEREGHTMQTLRRAERVRKALDSLR